MSLKEEYNKFLNRLIEIDNVENRKKYIIKKYGIEPTICYYYYVWNAINYVGRENVKQSFESIKGLGNEVIVGVYSSNDGTRRLAQECGLKVVDVEKTPGITFHESKIDNKIFHNTKCNFVVDLDVHTVYPRNLDDIIRHHITTKDISKKQLVLRGMYCEGDGSRRLEFAHCSSAIIYRPYLLEARGFDERTYYGHGTTYYVLGLLEDVYKLEMDNIYVNEMVHRYHMNNKIKVWAEKFDITISNTIYKDRMSLQNAENLLRPLKNNFGIGRKAVKNSYW